MHTQGVDWTGSLKWSMASDVYAADNNISVGKFSLPRLVFLLCSQKMSIPGSRDSMYFSYGKYLHCFLDANVALKLLKYKTTCLRNKAWVPSTFNYLPLFWIEIYMTSKGNRELSRMQNWACHLLSENETSGHFLYCDLMPWNYRKITNSNHIFAL